MDANLLTVIPDVGTLGSNSCEDDASFSLLNGVDGTFISLDGLGCCFLLVTEDLVEAI